MKEIFEKIKKFTMKNKKAVIAGAIALLVVIAGIVIVCTMNQADNNRTKKKTNETKAITSENLIKEVKLEGLVFNNVMLLKKGEMYTLTMDVRNETDHEIDIPQVNIDMLDKKGNNLITLLGYIGEKIQPNETRTITASAQINLSKVQDKKIYIGEKQS